MSERLDGARGMVEAMCVADTNGNVVDADIAESQRRILAFELAVRLDEQAIHHQRILAAVEALPRAGRTYDGEELVKRSAVVAALAALAPKEAPDA